MEEHNHHNEEPNTEKPVDQKPDEKPSEKPAEKPAENAADNDTIDNLAGIDDESLESVATDDDDLVSAFAELKGESDFNVSDQMTANINNAELMLSYIVNQGIEIDEKLVQSVVKCKYMYQKHKWNPIIEVEFNMTFRKLTTLIKPVTVDSLASSMSSSLKEGWFDRILKFFHINQRNALAKRSVRGYTIATICCMIVLLTLQIFFYLGSTRLSNITEYDSQIDVKQERLDELMLVQNETTNTAITTEADRVSQAIDELDKQKASNINLLGPWVRTIRRFTFNTTIKTDTIPEEAQGAQQTEWNTAIIQEAKSYVLILGIYVLPLLYGIIGGFTFVLRELTQEIKTLTFSTGSNVKYLLRILLGAIAGLSIGLFWSDIEKAQQFGLSSLSPMLLAFLGGYAVEYLLQFIEKLANAFFKRYDPAAEAAKETKKAMAEKESEKPKPEPADPKKE